MYLSPCVEEPLNSKVIKSFVPELKSRKYFSCFEIPMFSVYKYMNIICPFRLSIDSYGKGIKNIKIHLRQIKALMRKMKKREIKEKQLDVHIEEFKDNTEKSKRGHKEKIIPRL